MKTLTTGIPLINSTPLIPRFSDVVIYSSISFLVLGPIIIDILAMAKAIPSRQIIPSLISTTRINTIMSIGTTTAEAISGIIWAIKLWVFEALSSIILLILPESSFSK